MFVVYRQKGSVRKTYQTAGGTSVVLPTGCPHSAGFLAGTCICWRESQRPLYSQGLGTMVTNDWCINGEAIIKQCSDSINDKFISYNFE